MQLFPAGSLQVRRYESLEYREARSLTYFQIAASSSILANPLLVHRAIDSVLYPEGLEVRQSNCFDSALLNLKSPFIGSLLYYAIKCSISMFICSLMLFLLLLPFLPILVLPQSSSMLKAQELFVHEKL
jgi:hypothetical protein